MVGYRYTIFLRTECSCSPMQRKKPKCFICYNRYRCEIGVHLLTHWDQVKHICSKLTITGSDNGLSLGQLQAIIWTNAGVLLIGPLGTNFSEILIEIHIHVFSFKKVHLKISSRNWRPFCLGLSVKCSLGLYFPICSFSMHSIIQDTEKSLRHQMSRYQKSQLNSSQLNKFYCHIWNTMEC